ncbi:MAG: ATP-grasp domain-containing protein [Planctomycetes bacterium]|nr:ATP-grasp domain-containing protein [Planctomycetota bacterium]
MIDVFVTDAFQRKSLAAVRALGRAGLRVAAGEVTRWSPALWSRYVREAWVYPDPPVAWLAERSRGWKVLMPMEEETLLAILDRRARFDCAIPFESAEKIRLVRDKAWVAAQPEAPRTVAGPPCVVKPRIGSGSRGRVFCGTAEEFHRLDLRDAVVQERVEGEARCVSLLYDMEGACAAAFVHRRLHEYPASGGPSTWRESVRDDALVERALRIVARVGWRGVIQLEFKGGSLLDVNPRFWGSLNLAVRCGMNFPHLLFRAAMGERVRQFDYAVGVRGIWKSGELLRSLSGRWPAWSGHDDYFDDRDRAAGWASWLSVIPVLTRFREFLRPRR